MSPLASPKEPCKATSLSAKKMEKSPSWLLNNKFTLICVFFAKKSTLNKTGNLNKDINGNKIKALGIVLWCSLFTPSTVVIVALNRVHQIMRCLDQSVVGKLLCNLEIIYMLAAVTVLFARKLLVTSVFPLALIAEHGGPQPVVRVYCHVSHGVQPGTGPLPGLQQPGSCTRGMVFSRYYWVLHSLCN